MTSFRQQNYADYELYKQSSVGAELLFKTGRVPAIVVGVTIDGWIVNYDLAINGTTFSLSIGLGTIVHSCGSSVRYRPKREDIY